MFNIVLVAPEIPGNTGSIGRTCVALNLGLILIKPYGFDLNEKSVRRAGLDYWQHVKLREYNSWQDFLNNENANSKNTLYFSKSATQVYYYAPYCKDGYLVFGSETTGLPANLLTTHHTYQLPIYSEHVRSLNLASAATTVAYEALRHLNFTA